jgi:hypothetical protein
VYFDTKAIQGGTRVLLMALILHFSSVISKKSFLGALDKVSDGISEKLMFFLQNDHSSH